MVSLARNRVIRPGWGVVVGAVFFGCALGALLSFLAVGVEDGGGGVGVRGGGVVDRVVGAKEEGEEGEVGEVFGNVLRGPPPAPSCPPVPLSVHAASRDGVIVGEGASGAQGWAADEILPKIEPSLYKHVHGVEPFEREENRPWELHAIPGNEWVGRAEQRMERCVGLEEGWDGEEERKGGDTTWVTALLDLKRGEKGSGSFRRSMDEYFARFQRVLDRGFPMVIFIPKRDFAGKLRLDKNLHTVVEFSTSTLELVFPYVSRVREIRKSPVWEKQAKSLGWLFESPQSQLDLYDPLVMSKVFLLRDAARLNPHHTRYFMWMDAGHACAGATNPGQIPVWEKLMESNRFLITHWPYASTTEVHGMLDKAMHLYVGTEADPLRIVRGGVLGGRRAAIECLAKIYPIPLHQSLTDGYLGTEENILAITFARFPNLFAPFDNGPGGDNCASFTANKRK